MGVKDESSNNFFDDEDYQDNLTILLAHDPKVLHDCAYLLTADDFKPLRGMKHGRARWVVAERALAYYEKYHEPISRMLRADVLDYAHEIGMGDRQIQELKEYVSIVRKTKVPGPDAISEKAIQYKRERLKVDALQELNEEMLNNKLTDEKWIEVMQRAVMTPTDSRAINNFFDPAKFEARVERRRADAIKSRIPVFFIDPLDSIVRGIGPGQVGVAIAPPKRGKSLFLEWLSLAYTLQHMSGIHLTLEDPADEVEDRLDAAATKVPIHKLHERPGLTRARFARFQRMVKSQLHVVDGTQGGFTVPRIDQMIAYERSNGRRIDYLVIDYDDEIVPSVKQKERRFEIAQVYRDIRKLAASYHIPVWTASQTQRNTEHLKVLVGDKVAEDYSIIRKSTMVLSLGQGDWGEDSIYLWVAAHRHDREHIGCNIMCDRSRMLIYDRDKTKRAVARQESQEEEQQ